MRINNVRTEPKDLYDVEAWNAFYLNNPGFHRSVGPDGVNDDGGGDGGDGGDGSDGGDGGGDGGDGGKDLQSQINSLKGTNDKLKSEKQKLKDEKAALKETEDILASLGGAEGLKVLQEYQNRINNDEMAKLLSEGKTDEWLSKRTEGLRKSHLNEIAARDESITASEARAVKAEKALETLQIDIGVREACRQAQGFEQSAIPDAIMLASNFFSYDEELGIPVIKDDDGGIVYGQDAKTPKPVLEWLTEQQEGRPHWWGDTKGSGGKGGKGKKGSELSLEEQLDQGLLTMEDYKKIRKERGFTNFG